MKKVRLLVVIVNYKTPKLIEQAIRSLEGEIIIGLDKVVVVDNCSNDQSVAIINRSISKNNWGEWVSLIESPTNGGFSAGNNLGIKSYDSNYYLLLNSDAYVKKDAVNNLIKTMEKDNGIGVLGPSIIWETGDIQVSCFNNMTPINEFLSASKTAVFTKVLKIFGVNEVAIPAGTTATSPDWISFACVLIRSEVIKNVGLMDEQYFMYREDNDYCRRSRDLGWQVSIEPRSKVVHLNQGLSGKVKLRKPSFYFESRSRYFKKFYGKKGLVLANVLWTTGRTLLLIRECITSKKGNIHLMTYFDIWKGIKNDSVK
jgi:GT2 family glycosyltransferase